MYVCMYVYKPHRSNHRGKHRCHYGSLPKVRWHNAFLHIHRLVSPGRCRYVHRLNLTPRFTKALCGGRISRSVRRPLRAASCRIDRHLNMGWCRRTPLLEKVRHRALQLGIVGDLLKVEELRRATQSLFRLQRPIVRLLSAREDLYCIALLSVLQPMSSRRDVDASCVSYSPQLRRFKARSDTGHSFTQS
jgi:hypothetical protein